VVGTGCTCTCTYTRDYGDLNLKPCSESGIITGVDCVSFLGYEEGGKHV